MTKFKVTKLTTNHDTGEITETTHVFAGKFNPRKYSTMFIDNLELLDKVNSMVDMRILLYLVKNMGYDSNEVIMNADIRTKICEHYKISKPALSKSLSNLKNLGIIDGGPYTYVVTKRLFWKGNIKNISK